MMEVLQQGLVAFFAAVGIAWAVWTAAGAIFLSKQERLEPCVVLIPAAGDAPALEETVAQLQWVRMGGRKFDRILIADCGLDGAARERAGALCRRSAGVVLCAMDDVPERLHKNTMD